MTDTTTKRRAPTWDDVKEAYAEGLYTPAPAEDDAGALASFWGATVGADWHPDTPANQVAEHEWRTDAPEAGTVIECRDGRRYVVNSERWARCVRNDAQRSPSSDAWRYLISTTSEDNS